MIGRRLQQAPPKPLIRWRSTRLSFACGSYAHCRAQLRRMVSKGARPSVRQQSVVAQGTVAGICGRGHYPDAEPGAERRISAHWSKRCRKTRKYPMGGRPMEITLAKQGVFILPAKITLDQAKEKAGEQKLNV